MMGAVILRVLQHARTGAKGRIVLVLDEAVNANLLGLHESQALAEAGKWGLEVHISCKTRSASRPRKIRSNVLQNCWRHEWFRQGQCGGRQTRGRGRRHAPTRSPPGPSHRVPDTQRRCRLRPRHDAQPERRPSIRAGRTVRGTGQHTALWPRRKDVKDAQDRYTTLSDQLTLMQKELMLLGTGYRFVRDDVAHAVGRSMSGGLSDPWSPSGERSIEVGRGSSAWLADAKFRMITDILKERHAQYRPIPADRRPPIPPGAARRMTES